MAKLILSSALIVLMTVFVGCSNAANSKTELAPARIKTSPSSAPAEHTRSKETADLFRTYWLESPTVLLWPKGAPGVKAAKENESEVTVHRHDTILDRAILNVHRPTLTMHLPPKALATGTAVIVCPGGGRRRLAIDKEGHSVAKWLNSIGVTGCVLKYRLSPDYTRQASLQDAQRAIRTLRSRAKEWNINPDRIGILGFSAGASLASSAGTHFQKPEYDPTDDIDKVSCRPDFMILGYGATSPERTQITPETPTAFLFLAGDDPVVPPERVISFYLALKKAKVPAEIHIYEKGGHGFGLGINGGAVTSWPTRCADWMKGRGLLNIGKKDKASMPTSSQQS